jgi:glutamate racemase
MNFLTTFPIRAAVVACGTVSTTSLPQLQKSFPIPIIGVVEGASRTAVTTTKNGHIAVIGTKATIASGAFPAEIKRLLPEARVTSTACPLFVPLVENNFLDPNDPIVELTVRRYLEPLLETDADTLILGCTHYPLLAPVISKILPRITLINTGTEAARLLREHICPQEDENEGSPAEIRYFVSDDAEGFAQAASIFLQTEVRGHVEKIEIESY